MMSARPTIIATAMNSTIGRYELRSALMRRLSFGGAVHFDYSNEL
jgi:hypothetical protein